MSTPLSMDAAIDYVLDKSKGLNLEVLAHSKKSTGVSFQSRKIEQFTFSETHQLGVRVVDGKNEGVAFTESLDPESLDDTIEQARENARMIQKDWTSDLQAATHLPKMEMLYNPSLDEVSVEDKVRAASLLESAALDFDPAITAVAYTKYSDVAAQTWIANTKGLRGSYRQNACSGYTYCVAKDGNNTVMAGEVQAGRDFSKFDAKKVAEDAAKRALARRGASRPDTGVYTVVFENRVAESLIGMISGYFSGKSLDEGTTPLKGKKDQKVFSEKLSFTDDPFHAQAPASRPFGEEGFTSQKTTLVENGVVRSFLTNSVLARKLGLPHTASASRAPSTDLDVGCTNIIVKLGTTKLSDMLNADQRVILVTSIQGTAGFRATSGDFSLPVEGELFENGKRIGALKDFLLSGNILKTLSDVEMVGNDPREPVGNVVSPSLLVRGVNVAGKS